MEKRQIKLADLVQNTGQIEGLPSNPRQWTRTDIDLLKASIEETPELLEARGLLVYPFDGKYVIIGGNLRFAAVQEMGWNEVTCEVLPQDIPIDTLKAMVIKDNGSFGAWDYDSLANQWDDLPLADWGAPAWAQDNVVDPDSLFDEQVENKEKNPVIKVEVPVSFKDKLEDIKTSIALTIEEWKGCKIR